MKLLYIEIALIVLGAILFKVFHAKIYGWLGEMVLHWWLKSKLDKRQYIVMHNIMLPTEEGTTTQIDHIVVSQWGIFVIETKTFAGHIYGKAEEPRWTAKYHPRQKGFMIQNPLRQNYKHIATLAECLGIGQEYFKTVVAFAGTARFGKDMPPEVMHFGDVVEYIQGKSTETIILQEQTKEVADTIIAWQNTLSRAQKSAHVENLHKTHPQRRTAQPAAEEVPSTTVAPAAAPTAPTAPIAKESAVPVCPKCGDPMVLRQRKGDGGKFWGCPNFPKCRSIININE